MVLKIKWRIFYNQVNDYIREARDILNQGKGDFRHASYEFLVYEVNTWIAKCHNYLRNSFDKPDNAYAEGFYSEKAYSYYLTGAGNKEKLGLKEIFQNLSVKKGKLEKSLRILSACDAVIQPGLVDTGLREKYGINDVMDLLLDKLYFLYDNYYYPIHTILRGNGIITRNYRELPALIQKYEYEGYIRLISTNSICARLTSKGKDMIEKRRSFNNPELKNMNALEEMDFDCFRKDIYTTKELNQMDKRTIIRENGNIEQGVSYMKGKMNFIEEPI